MNRKKSQRLSAVFTSLLMLMSMLASWGGDNGRITAIAIDFLSYDEALNYFDFSTAIGNWTEKYQCSDEQAYTSILNGTSHELIVRIGTYARDHGGKVVGVTNSFRPASYQEQIAVVQNNCLSWDSSSCKNVSLSTSNEEAYFAYLQCGKSTSSRVASPGRSDHNSGNCMDVNGWLTGVSSSALSSYGLIKNVSSEDWHISVNDSEFSGYDRYLHGLAIGGEIVLMPCRAGAGYLNKGASVAMVQRRLAQLGYSITVDGIYSSGTAGVVEQYQNDHGLVADAICGNATLHSLYPELYTPVPPPDPTPIGFEMSEGAGQTIPDGDYAIFSAINPDYYLDIIGADWPAPEGTNVGMYTIETGTLPNSVDCWTVEYLNNGFYKIRQKDTSMCLDVYGADQHRGTNVQTWTDNGSVAQQWSISRTNNGYKIQSRCCSYYLDVNGGVFELLTNVQVWEGNDSAAQLFCFVPYGKEIGQTVPDGEYVIGLAKDNQYCLDCQGYSTEDYSLRTNVQLWETTTCNDSYIFTYVGDGYYTIAEATTGYVLDIYNKEPSEYLTAAQNIQLYEYNATKRNQKWMIKPNGDGSYTFISQLSGYCMDLHGGTVVLRGNIEQYPFNGTDAQKWLLIPAMNAPQKCDLMMRKTEAFVGERVPFIGISDTADKFTLHVQKDGKDFLTDETPNDQIDLMFEEAGNYSAYMTAINRKGEIDSDHIAFTIKDTLRLHSDEKLQLSYDAGYAFKTSNADVVVVSKSGEISAIAEGKATITVIDTDKNAYQIKVTVTDKEISGDCNNDGLLSILDIVALQKWLLAMPDTHLPSTEAVDMNSDGIVDVFDLGLLKWVLLQQEE